MKIFKRYQNDLSDILKVKAIDLPANPLKVRSPIFNECRIKDTNISSRKSRVSPGKFITLTSFDVAIIAVAMIIVVVLLAIELVLQKNRKSKIRTCIDQNNNESHRVDNSPNLHENLSESNSPSERNVSNSNIDDENEKGKSIKKSKHVANLDETNCYNAKINKQKPNSNPTNNNKSKSQPNLITEFQREKTVMDFFKASGNDGNFGGLTSVIEFLINGKISENPEFFMEKGESENLNKWLSGVISKISDLFADYAVKVLNKNCDGRYKKISPKGEDDKYKISKDGQEDNYVFYIKIANKLNNSDNVKLADLKFKLTSCSSHRGDRYTCFKFPNNSKIHQE